MKNKRKYIDKMRHRSSDLAGRTPPIFESEYVQQIIIGRFTFPPHFFNSYRERVCVLGDDLEIAKIVSHSLNDTERIPGSIDPYGDYKVLVDIHQHDPDLSHGIYIIPLRQDKHRENAGRNLLVPMTVLYAQERLAMIVENKLI